MYCISCGNKLQDSVAFCPNCGKKQSNEAIEVISSMEAENVRKGEKYEKTSFSDIVFARKAMSVYLIWALLHVTLLLIFSDGIFDKENSNEGMIDF